MGKASRKKKGLQPESGSRAEVAERDLPGPLRAPAHGKLSSLQSRPALAVCIALVVANLLIYAPVRQFDFTNTDDPVYVTDQPNVLGGLSWASVKWALTDANVPYWHPLTFLSHMLDVEMYGTNAAGHHLTSVVLHVACAVMLFALLLRMTGAFWRSAIVAALFSLHPLRVESVAWIAERKDVLSAFFWIATMMAYLHYVRRPGFKRYATMVVLFALGLMAKPMVVTLPFALLLLDYWPLERVSLGDASPRRGRMSPAALLKEKIPLFGLAVLASAVTFVTQRNVGAVNTLEEISLPLRVSNSLHSYVAYLGDMFWPTKLVALYPYPDAVSLSWVLVAIPVLAAITAFVLVLRRTQPYLLVGWFWYLGTLLPVIGLIQVGPQARADRFTYVPQIGILLMVVWGVYELARRLPNPRVVLAPLGTAAIVACTLISMRQVHIWSDSVTLWEHTLRLTRDNGIAHYNLGVQFVGTDRVDDGIRQLREAVRLEPRYAIAHNRLALAIDSKGHTPEVTKLLADVVRILPTSPDAYANLGISLAKDGKNAEAIAAFEQALLLNPNDGVVRGRLEYLRKRPGAAPPAAPPDTSPPGQPRR
jgi:protein O-mannosyl-transferase